MLNRILGFILAIGALLGAGALSYTYFEQTMGPRVGVPIAEVVSKSANTTATKIAPKVTKVPAKISIKATVKTNIKVATATSPQKPIVAPTPLRLVTEASATPPSGDLSVRGVIEYTNGARASNGGLPALIENQTLDRDAQMKLSDMFAKQYFEHISPTGVGPGELAKTVGYAYILVGENLALGDFGSDEKLVTAWMNSPGHRANILNSHYQEIGVAVGKGMYEGRETWLAVQGFGMPTSACPSIDASMKAQIDSNNTQIANLRAELDAKKAQIDSTSTNDPNYNTYVSEFNALVPEYNALIESNRVTIATYNAQVQTYNDCVNAAGAH